MCHSLEPKFRPLNKGDEQSDKPYHARGMSLLAGTAQRLKRVFNIDTNECEKCEKHNVSIIACIIDILAIQKPTVTKGSIWRLFVLYFQ
ncbi:MAG: hypothetical protein ACI97K_002359 [Glaciecola sp.]|jgi:hypothetical protein